VNETSEPATAGRRQAWLGLLLILLALAVLIWQAFLAGAGNDVDLPSPTGRPAQIDAAGRADAAVPMFSEVLPVPVAAGTAGSPVPKGQMEVCGLGRVSVDDAGQPLQPELLERPLREARERMLLALASSADETERAAGLFIRSAGFPSRVFSPSADATSEATSEREDGQAQARKAAARDALAGMAAYTRLPQVYALALNACARTGTEGACGLLSSAQWARLDPRNAAPWVRVAHEAAARRDTAGVSEALFHIAHADLNDARALSLVTVATARVPADAPPFVRTSLAGEVLAFTFAGMPSPSVVANHCSKEALADSNRLQACAAVAELLTRRDGTLVDLTVGTQVGERVGWPAERVQALRDERDAMAEVLAKVFPEAFDLMGCDAQQRLGRHIAEMGAHGEVGALRRALAQSPDGVAVLAKRLRDRRAQQNASERAASGP